MANRGRFRLAVQQGRLFRALRHRSYRLFFAAFAVNQIGFWVSHISLQGLMVELSGNDPFQVGLLFFFLFTPAFFFGPFAGVAADRFDRKAIVLGTYVTIAALMLLLTALVLLDASSTHLVLLLAFLMGTCFTFGNPAGTALAANVVEIEDLASAVSLQSATNNLTRVIGPALAAPLLASGRFAVAFGLFAVASLAAASLVTRIHVPMTSRDTAEPSGVLARIRGGLAHARERKPALAALLTISVLALFGVSHVALLPVFAEHVLGRKEAFAWLVAASGLGAMAGAIMTGRRARPTLFAAAVSLVVYGLALGVFALSRSVFVALLLQLVVGYCYFSVMTGLQTLLQQIVDDAKRGRMMSLFQMAWAGFVPFGALAMGTMAAPLGVVATLLIAASICLAFGALTALRAEPR
jgi:MFS family permease